MKKLIVLENLVLGMEAASAVLNKFGQVLIASGTKIEDKHKAILKTWGISTIEVIDYENDSDTNKIEDEVKQNIKNGFLKKVLWSPRNKNEEDLIEMGLQNKIEFFLNSKK